MPPSRPQSGDLILKVDGQVVAASPDQVSRVVGLIKASPERAMAFTVQRKVRDGGGCGMRGPHFDVALEARGLQL